ncbi:MAG: GNAT family N-acetyltransferase [Gemmatimonadetes bacterium]|nr:GNAT family N-acetyltransferase [Gemmatimonadota bacterium]
MYTLGVVPKKRGQGYVNDLLARGTQILEHEGADCIRSTTAATNFPMVNAFERAHYKQIEHWWGFEIHLNSKT